MGGWRYVSCFIWDHNLYRVWHHITPRATGCMVFGCMEGKTKNPTSNNSDKRWETGAQFLFCCLTFCCLMFLEFSQWHVLWKKDMTCIFQICMCTAVEWSAICLPWVSPSAYGASQLLGFGNRFVENWKVMGGIGKTQPCNLSDSEPSCQLQYVYSIDTVSGEAGSKVIYPSKSRQSCSQKHVQSILKSLEYEAQIMATRFFFTKILVQKTRACGRCVEGIFRQVVALFFTSTLPWWNGTISSEVLRLMLLLIVATGSHSILNAGVWTWPRRDAAVSKKCKAQSAVLCLTQFYSFYVVIVDVGFVLCSCGWAIYNLENTMSCSSDSQ